MLWVLKDWVVPDKSFDTKITTMSGLIITGVLAGYWLPAYFLISSNKQVSPQLAALAISIHTIGCVLMIASDSQKYFTLKVSKGLISNGWFARSRNINYFGEVLIYGSYCLLSQHPLPWMYCIFIWLFMFMSFMSKKEESLKKKSGWESYAKESNFFFPKLF